MVLQLEQQKGVEGCLVAQASLLQAQNREQLGQWTCLEVKAYQGAEAAYRAVA